MGPSRPRAEIRRFLAAALDRIVGRFRPEALVFFGSRLDGTPHEWSDIDLLIVSREFQGMRVLPRMARFRKVAQPHIRVDAICYTPRELEYMMTQPSMVGDVMATGLRII
ncbi:MAG: nucleotidyltransferase domain-containing protein [Armatimonadetes bacterium]|nr:nucleotidyltransferase domain-containing protein [Armatimonadota bacterium]